MDESPPVDSKPNINYLKVWDAVLFVIISGILNIIISLLVFALLALYNFLFNHVSMDNIMDLFKKSILNGYVIVLTNGIYYILIFIIILGFLTYRHLNFKETLALKPLSEYHPRFLLLLTLLLLCFGFTVSYIFREWMRNSAMLEILTSGQGILAFCLFMSLITPIVEETIFRGFIFNPLERKWGACTAGIVVTILFVSIHVPQLIGALPALLPITLLGIITAYLRAVRKSIFPGCVVHTIYNSVLMSIVLINHYFLHYT